MMRYYRPWVQHVSNPLHVYCRLIDFGISTEFSRRLGVIYEKYFYHLLRVTREAWSSSKKRSS